MFLYDELLKFCNGSHQAPIPRHAPLIYYYHTLDFTILHKARYNTFIRASRDKRIHSFTHTHIR